jgi:hypothetical protein
VLVYGLHIKKALDADRVSELSKYLVSCLTARSVEWWARMCVVDQLLDDVC